MEITTGGWSWSAPGRGNACELLEKLADFETLLFGFEPEVGLYFIVSERVDQGMDLVRLVTPVKREQSLRADRYEVGKSTSKTRLADIQANTEDDDVAKYQVHRNFKPDSWKSVKETSDEAHALGYRSNPKVALLALACLSPLR